MIGKLAHMLGYILDEYILGGYTYREEERKKWNEAVASAVERLDKSLAKDRAA